MALKGERGYQVDTDIAWVWDGGTALRGGVASILSAGSGVALGDTANKCNYAVDPSGAITKPLGVLLQDIVSVDTTKYHVNQHKNVAQSGQRVTLVRRGWVVTDMIASVTPAAGDPAYLAASGKITNVQAADALPKQVGRFETKKDQDGFAKVFINIE